MRPAPGKRMPPGSGACWRRSGQAAPQCRHHPLKERNIQHIADDIHLPRGKAGWAHQRLHLLWVLDSLHREGAKAWQKSQQPLHCTCGILRHGRGSLSGSLLAIEQWEH